MNSIDPSVYLIVTVAVSWFGLSVWCGILLGWMLREDREGNQS